MSDPYRSPTPPREEEGNDAPRQEGLGALRSKHDRAITGSALAAATGGWLSVDLHEQGLAWRRAERGPRFEVPFGEIDAIHYDCDRFIPGPPRVVLVTFDGERIAIPSDLHDLDVVLDAIDRAVTLPLIARAKDALARGERLVFGPLVLQLDGIELKGDGLSWGNLARVVAERDSIVFHANGPRGRFGWARLIDLPHPRALLDVLRMRTRVVIEGLRLRANDS